MAIRLSIAFKTTAESWLSQQMQYDLWKSAQQTKENESCEGGCVITLI